MSDSTAINCQSFEDKLHLFIGGDLDSDLVNACELHRQACAPCADLYGDAQTARQAYFEVSHAALANDLADRGLNLWPAVRDELQSAGVLGDQPLLANRGDVPTGVHSDGQPLALGLPSSAGESAAVLAMPQEERGGRRNWARSLATGGLAAAAALVIAFQLGGDRTSSGAPTAGDSSSSPAVAVSMEGDLPVQGNLQPAAGGLGLQANGAEVASEGLADEPGAGSLRPIRYEDSLVVESYQLQLEQLSQSGLAVGHVDPTKLAGDVSIQLR